MSFKFTPISTYDPNASEENDREDYHKWYEHEQINRMPPKELRENLTFLYEKVERPECDFVFVCSICIKHILDESLVEAHLKFCKRKENHAPTDAFFRQMFECPYCPKEFALRRTLADHVKNKHPNATNEDLIENVIVSDNKKEEKAKFSKENEFTTGSEVVKANEFAVKNQVVVKNEVMAENDNAVVEVMAENDDAVIEVMAENDDDVIEVMAENDDDVIEVMADNDDDVIEVMAENDDAVVEVMAENNDAVVEVMAKNDDAVIEVMAENADAVTEVMANNSNTVVNEDMIENNYVSGNQFAAGPSKARVPREKRYKCPHCPKTYVWEKVMVRHIIQIHTVMPVKKVKPEPISESNEVIVCRICFMHFQQHSDFRCHMNLYHPMDPTTEVIEKKFNITEGKPYVCSVCYKIFSRNATLNRHQLTTHTVGDQDVSDDEDVPPPKKIRKRKSPYQATKKTAMNN